MDIDAPPPVTEAGAFSLVFPLPFRILSLLSLGVLAWSTNVHGVVAIGIDAAQVLDVRLEDLDSAATAAGGGASSLGGATSGGRELLPRTHPASDRSGAVGAGGPAGVEGAGVVRKGPTSAFIHPTRLYPPAYQLSLALSLWTLVGWACFRFFTAGDPDTVRRWTVFPFLWAALALVALISPWTTLHRRERIMALRSFKRIALEGLTAPVPFCDVLMADVMTSFAKVMGDVWVSGCLVVGSEHGLASQVSDLGCYKEFMVPFMTRCVAWPSQHAQADLVMNVHSVPYIFRLRQCLAEYFGRHTATPRRSLLNALKYASAFPVIILSAMQGVYGDPFDAEEPGKARSSLPSVLFNLWILAVFVNSLYSFWWDVTNDWGLSLLTPQGWSQGRSRDRRRRNTGPIRLPSPTPGSAATLVGGAGGPSGNRVSPPLLETGHRPSASGWTPTTRQGDTMHRSRSQSVQLAGTVTTPDLSAESDDLATFPPSAPSVKPVGQSGPARSANAGRHGHVGFASDTRHHGHGHHGHHHSRRRSIFNLPFTADPPFLRPTLLLPDPLIYYLAIGIDLLLRFTWSLKLSSHLHEIHEIESGVFLMEGLEVARRWMWTFLRIEWEAVKKSAAPGGSSILMDDPDSVGSAVGGGPVGREPGDDGQGYSYERSALGGSSYLHVGSHDALGLAKIKDSDYETDDSMIVVDRGAGREKNDV